MNEPGDIAIISPCGWGNLGDAAIVDSVIAAIRTRLPGYGIVAYTQRPTDTAERHGIPAGTCAGWSTDFYGVQPGMSDIIEPSSAAPVESMPEESGHDAGRHVSAASLRSRLVNRIRHAPGVSGARYVRRVVTGEVRQRRVMSARSRPSLILVAGGGQLDDYWGGAFGHPHTLWRWARHARAVGCPFVVLSVGTGSLGTPLARQFVRRALALASYRSFRDEGSRQLVGLPLLHSDPIVPDLAYAHPVRPGEPQPPGSLPVIGVSPIAHRDPPTSPRPDVHRYDSYLRRLAALSVNILEAGYKIALFGTDGTDVRISIDDLYNRIAECVKSPAYMARVQRPRVTTLHELFSLYSRLHAMVGSRMHGILLSQMYGVPAYALCYERKVVTLMSTLGQDRFSEDIDVFEPRRTFQRLNVMLNERFNLYSQLRAPMDGFRREVDQQYDHVFGTFVKR